MKVCARMVGAGTRKGFQYKMRTRDRKGKDDGNERGKVGTPCSNNRVVRDARSTYTAVGRLIKKAMTRLTSEIERLRHTIANLIARI